MATPTQAPLDMEKHVKEEHNRSLVAEYLKEIVYGGVDGIITTFAVVAGFSGAEISTSMTTIPVFSVLLFGLANLFADATSMGMGNFLSVRADQDVYSREKKKEHHEIKENPEFEQQETITILQKKGFSQTQAHNLTKIIMTNKEYWVEFMMKNELNMSDPHEENPLFTGFATFAAFIIFGSVPLVPYLFFARSPIDLFTFSLIATSIALVILGIFRWKVTSQHFVRSVVETVGVGFLSAAVAYGIGTLFSV